MQTHPKILLAEDDDYDAYFIGKAVLEIFPDFEYERLNNGSRLLASLQKQNSNVAFVLLDLNMPSLNGRDTLCAIRETYGDKFPVYILSNSNHLHEKEFCLQNGANTYYVKPISYEGYQSIINQCNYEYLEQEAVKVNHPNKTSGNSLT